MNTASGTPGEVAPRLSKQILCYGRILLVVSICFGVFLVFNTHREWQGHAGNFARYIARAIALDIKDALLVQDAARLGDKLGAIGHNNMVSLACLYDQAGLVASYTKAEPAHSAIACPTTQNVAVPRHVHALETVYAEQSSKAIGYVTVHISNQMVESQTLRGSVPILVALLVALSLVFAGTHWSNRRATRSLTTLTDYARTTNGNTADFPHIAHAPEEIVELAEAFRRLVNHLVAAREEVTREVETRRLAQGEE